MLSPENRFNLVDEPWIPIAGEGLAGLRSVFTEPRFRALGGNPVQKIALTKLLLAIAQTAYTPRDDEDWKHLGPDGLAQKAVEYLEEKKDCFWLYGPRPFLQMPLVTKASVQSFGAVTPHVATGNTTVLMQLQQERDLLEAERALSLVTLMGFALGGKKTDNKVVLSPNYFGKSNEKGKPSTGKPGPAIGFLGYLHSFLLGSSLIETIWLNTITQQDLRGFPQLSQGIGCPPWEKMPQGEDCPTARILKESYLGRLIPLCRFVLLHSEGIHYTEGIVHPNHKNGYTDLSVAVDNSKDPKVKWADPEKRPWRELTSLLSFFEAEQKGNFDCLQIRTGIRRGREKLARIGIWSGGLRVSSNAGEQYVSGGGDYVESQIYFESAWLGKSWFINLKNEMTALEGIAKFTFGCVQGYYREFHSDGTLQAAQATRIFWQLCERQFQSLVDACNSPDSDNLKGLRRVFADYCWNAFDAYCPKETARQIAAWAKTRPNLAVYLSKQ